MYLIKASKPRYLINGFNLNLALSLLLITPLASYTASCEYRSKRFLTAVITRQSLENVGRWLDRGANVNYLGELWQPGRFDALDKYGWYGTALHWAAKHNHKQLVSLLLAYEADKSILDSDGKAPFRYAQHKKLKQALWTAPVPQKLATGLGVQKHYNWFDFRMVPAGWDLT